MRKALKEIIDTAEEKKVGYFDILMFVPNGVYDGFWGKNGYDNIRILGYDRTEKKWFTVSTYGDVFSIYSTVGYCFTLDINHDYGVPTISFGKPVYIDNELGVSSVLGELKEREKK